MKATLGGRICVARDAVTGRFIPLKVAKRRKKTTVIERSRRARLGNGRFAKMRP